VTRLLPLLFLSACVQPRPAESPEAKQIAALSARLDAIEERIAELEQRPTSINIKAEGFSMAIYPTTNLGTRPRVASAKGKP